ncbi:MAG: hemolysin III family protein [Coriobacteriales bacterium]|nr:hemolysin III family protein [Actinomycetes bacterium]
MPFEGAAIPDEPTETKKQARPYSLGEEIANAITHGLGVALSVAALTLLVVFAAIWGNGWHLASAIVYGVTLVVLYLASTLYHSIQHEKARRVLRIVDHSSIYLLIAGTYTPFTLVTLRDSGGWWLFGIVWGLALAGVVLEAFAIDRPKWMSLPLYIAMGWLVVVAIRPLVANLPSGGVWLLVAGGLAYTLGTVFYILKRVPYMHMVWHLFVLAGSVCHFLAVMLFVLPRP